MNSRLQLSLVALLLILNGCAGPTEPAAKNNALYALQLVSQTITPGWALDVWVHNDTAYVANDEQGVMIYDVRNISSPVLVDTIHSDGKALGVGYAPLTNLVLVMERFRTNGLAVYDRATKGYLGKVGTGVSSDFDFIELARDTIIIAEIQADGTEDYQFNKWYWSAEFSGWAQLSGVYNYASGARGFFYGFCLDSSMVYFANGERGLAVANTNYSTWGNFRTTPLGQADTPGSAREVVLNSHKTHLFVADWQAGLQVINIQDKTNPRVVGGLIPTGVNEVQDVRAYGDTAVFTDRLNGIFAADVRDPANPSLIAVYDTPDPQGFFIRQSDGTIFLTDQELGLLVLQFRR